MKSLLTTIGLSLLSASVAHAEMFMGNTELSEKVLEDVIIMGPAQLTNIKAKSLKIAGPLSFSRLDISENVMVVGPVKDNSTDLLCKELDVVGSITAKNIKATNITILGPAKLENVDASSDIKVIGSLDLKNAKLKNLYLTTNDIHLDNVTVNNITIDKIPLSSEDQKLILHGSTNVTGSIKFESGKGIVIIKDKATTSGKIAGGVIQKNEAQK